MQGDSSALLYFDKLNDERKYSGEPVGVLELKHLETPMEGPQGFSFIQNNKLLLNINDQNFVVSFIEQEELKGSWCCTNHSPKHCGDVDDLKDLVKKYHCEGFESI